MTTLPQPSLAGEPLFRNPLFQRLTNGAWRPGGTRLTEQGLAMCGLARGAHVVDVGCGAGATLTLLRSHGFYALGVDSNATQAARAHAGYCLTATATALPLASDSMDGLVCECVLSLLADAPRALRECARVLRPAGSMLLTDMYARHADASLQFSMHPAQSTCDDADTRAASRSCADAPRSRAMLEAMFTAAGLHVLHFSDHSAALAALAAHLVWHDVPSPTRCACATGYGMWILRK